MRPMIDLMLRLAILEAFAHLPAGTWSANPIGREAARQALPGVHKKWFADGTLAHESIVSGITAAFRFHTGSNPTAEDIEDLIQDICAKTTCGGGACAAIGGYLNPRRLPNLNAALHLLRRHAMQRATDRALLVSATADRTLRVVDYAEDETPTVDFDPDAAHDSVIELNAKRDMLDSLMYDLDARPSDLRIYERWLERLDEDVSPIADDLGVSRSFATAAMRRVMERSGLNWPTRKAA